MSGSAAAAAAAASNAAEGQATLVGVSASLSAADQSAAYATPVPDSPMPGVSQGSSSDVVGATLVGASALRQSQVDPELERMTSRGPPIPPAETWQPRYAEHSADTSRLLPNKDANYDARTETCLTTRNNSITPIPIWGLDLKDKRHVHYSSLGFIKVILPLTNFSSRVPAPKRRLTADENFQWELAHFLEGRTEACLSRPSWNDAIHYIGHFWCA